ncbi:hypothetical protein SDC9_130253 [bioreactor metagenome]|uniref:Uncharacterized protein n=1 Tax=bioreactor metagenome TaxID=1076179 RepID=A0A645D0Z7_9ZZZZ
MQIDGGAESNLLKLDYFLIFALLFFTLALFEFVLAIIHDLAHGRCGIGGDLHQVQACLVRHVHSHIQRNDALLVPFRIDQAHFLVADLLVDEQIILSDGGHLH